jgi:hypothetical protein
MDTAHKYQSDVTRFVCYGKLLMLWCIVRLLVKHCFVCMTKSGLSRYADDKYNVETDKTGPASV